MINKLNAAKIAVIINSMVLPDSNQLRHPSCSNENLLKFIFWEFSYPIDFTLKVNGKYYLFNITWPRGGMRTVIVHHSDKITGPYESRLALQDRGIAQGGLIDTPAGD